MRPLIIDVLFQRASLTSALEGHGVAHGQLSMPSSIGKDLSIFFDERYRQQKRHQRSIKLTGTSTLPLNFFL